MTVEEAIIPFSPLRRDEEAILDAYVSKKPATPYLNRVLKELGASANSDLGISAIDNGAAMIIGRYAGGTLLPNFSYFDEWGQIHYTREETEKARKSRRLFSQAVLTINWASNPGMDWPDQYRVTWLPNQNCWVLTSALDCDEAWGTADLALGRFTCEKSKIARKAAPRILRHWKRLRDNFAQEAWESTLDDGLVDDDVACRWRQKVWPDECYDDDDL